MGLWLACNRWTGRAGALAARMRTDTRGNVAMMFAMIMPVLLLMSFAGVDIHRASTARVKMQDALDAATLAAARSPYTAQADIQRIGLAALRANIQAFPQITLADEDVTFTLTEDDIVIGAAHGSVDALVANIFLPPYGAMSDDHIEVGTTSEVDRSARNIEVALVLDVTGSMAGQRIVDLKKAAKDLVDIVVQQEQSPFYSRVSLVPYSMGVNLGSKAGTARGGVTGSTNVTGATYSVGSTKNIGGATRANPARITANGHGFANGDVVWITGVGGMTQLNNKAFVVANATTNTFTLRRNNANVNSSNYNSYESGGTVRECQYSNCAVVITSNNHNLQNLDHVHFTNVGGMTQINNKSFVVGNRTANTFTIDFDASDSPSSYTSGGKAWCAQQGCQYYAFDNMYDDLVTHGISTCVTERTGGAAYTDAGTASKVGRNYPGASNGCLRSEITPMSSDKARLKADIDTYIAEGSTAGQIGMAWGWYMVSPNFNALWSGPGAATYDTSETLKAVVIMTDGEYNTPYCNGVISQQAGVGSGNNNEKIGCDSTNGDPFTQGRALCDGMKNKGIVVYTVGFQLATGGEAEAMLKDCASTSSNFFLPSSGGDLSQAFKAIGRDITKLRISR